MSWTPSPAEIPQFWPILHFLGLLCPPSYQSRPNLACNSKPTVYVYTINYIWIGLFWKGYKNSKFNKIFTLWGLVPISLYQSRPNLAWRGIPSIYTYLPNFIWIHLLCRLPLVKYHNWDKFLLFGGYCPTPFTNKAKFGVLEQTPVLCLCAKFCLDWFILLPCGSGKKYHQFFGLRHFCGVDSWWYTEKVECWCTNTNLKNHFYIPKPSGQSHAHCYSKV